MNVDLTAAARRADPEEARAWLIEQRVFISSAMADTADERRAVAEAVVAEGARAVLFEELGRDAGAGEAYLTGVDSARGTTAHLLLAVTLLRSPSDADRLCGEPRVVCAMSGSARRHGGVLPGSARLGPRRRGYPASRWISRG